MIADLAETEARTQTSRSSSAPHTQGTSQVGATEHHKSSILCHTQEAEGPGYWQITWLYLTSLLKLGEVYELAGSHEDASHAFKEGQELVSWFQLPGAAI